MELRNKYLTVLIIFISFFMFVNYVKADPSISSGNSNVNSSAGGSGSGGSGKTNFQSERNILYLRAFSGDKVVKSGYVDITGNSNNTDSSAKKCYISNDNNTSYNHNTLEDVYKKFNCSTGSITIKKAYTYKKNGRAWSFDGVEAVDVDDWLKANTYEILKDMLASIGYTSASWKNGDYVIVEPVVDVKCDGTVYYGTVTALMARNICFRENSRPSDLPAAASKNAFMYGYSRIANGFKVTSNSCVEKVPRKKGKYSVGYNTTYNGCGYNRYNVSDINPTPNPEGKLTLIKTKSDGTTRITGSPVTVKIVNASDSSKFITKTFTGKIKDIELDYGTYNIYETKAPSGYYIPNNNYFVGTITLDKNNPTVSFTIKNSTECEYKFDNWDTTKYGDKNTIGGRIKFYMQNTNFQKYNNILNTEKKFGRDACTTNNCERKYNSGCLGVKDSNAFNNFSDTNLSCYDSKEVIDGKTYAFCKSIFNFNRNIDNNGIKQDRFEYNNGPVNFGTYISGKMILFRDTGDRKIAEGILKKTCYVYGDSKETYTNNKKNYKNSDYEDQIKSVKLYKESDKSGINYLEEGNFKSNITNTIVSSNSLIKHDVTMQYDYLLKPVYAKYGSGKVISSSSNFKKREIGYGIISTFKEIGKIKLKFDVKLKNENISNNSCTYEVEQELIKCVNGTCDDDSWRLNLVFREIDKSNPFPGKSGNGRKVGSNWCDENGNVSHPICVVENNSVIKDTITDKNDSYNSTGAGPKYTIILNSSTIKEIKNKYKNQAYDDFGENCNDASKGTCPSNFITWMTNKGYLY